jgi:peptidoglycan/xylan/chitin deacetylase (PgdA/CDA1 family)
MLMHVFSRGGKSGLSILIYHRVLAHKDPLMPGEIDCADFDEQMGLLKASCNVLSLTAAVGHLRAGTLPPRAACITFDDGYADNVEQALPILQRHGLQATFFVATGFLNGGRMWNDTVIELVRAAPGPMFDASAIGLGQHAVNTPAQRARAVPALIGKLKYLPLEQRAAQVAQLATALDLPLPTTLMMSDEQVRQLHRAGMEIGGHTVNHPILSRLTPEQARIEMAAGKATLEAVIGAPVRLFAYPNGKPKEDYHAGHVAMARELGFEGAVSTAWGAQKGEADVFQLPRFAPWDRSPLRFVLRLVRNLGQRAERAGV